MRRALAIISVVLCIVCFTIPAFAMKNEPEGFRGIPWGTPAPKDDISGRSNKWGLIPLPMDLLSRKAYERKGDELSINGAKVTYIRYIFQESLGFARVQILFGGLENYKLIREACLFNWGKPDYMLRNTGRRDKELKPERVTGEEKEDYSYESITYYWMGEKVIIVLQHDNDGYHLGSLRFFLANYYDATGNDDAKYFQEESGF